MEHFIVSARKYRPSTFESVVGQEHITSTLRNAISRGQLAHAYLFCGPRGVGKTTCARIFAKAINCQSSQGSGVCGECESCRSFDEGRSFNIHELDAASNNSVDDIRSLTEQVRIPPQIGKYSVYIIDEVHMLSAAAFNAFLKTLEEPPAHAVFILATTEKHKIIPTILSRCQIYDFNRIRVEDGVKYLRYIAGEEGITCDDESLHLIAQKADGGMRDALSMFDKAVSFCGTQLDFRSVAATLNVLDYDTYFNITDNILSGDYPTVLTAFDGVLRKGFSPQTFAAGLNAHFRDLLMCRDAQTAGLLEVTGSLMERYREQASRCDTGFLFEALSLVTSIDSGLRIATNQRLNVELGLMKLCSQGQKKNLNNEINPAGEAPQSLTLPDLRKGSAPAGTTPETTVRETHTVPAPTIQEAPVNPTVPTTVHRDETVAIEPDENIPQTPKEADIPTPSPEKGTPAETALVHPSPPADTPEQATQPKKPARATLSGTSISDLMVKPVGMYDAQAEETQDGKTILPADPDCADKIEKYRSKFIKKLGAERPRLAVPFGEMTVAGNKISVSVPSKELQEEILRNRTEILTLLSAVASVSGYIDLEVVVKEDSGPKLPVRVEDKLRYLTEKNPSLTLLRQKLDMDIE